MPKLTSCGEGFGFATGTHSITNHEAGIGQGRLIGRHKAMILLLEHAQRLTESKNLQAKVVPGTEEGAEAGEEG